MDAQKRILIAGNGPSLREVDFEDLRGIDWFGMNAAYRYWDKIGIYPTVYSCLDKVVIKSHAKEILRLFSENKIQKFFLVKDILEEIPDFPNDDRVFFLEDMIASDEPGSEIFKTAFSDKKTTGSWAVRFAIYLGYREIFLSGIDVNYVEIIEGAERTGTGLELKIGAEVKDNPNYFFNDYQKPGDVYQIPNPERHFGNLHLQSFEALNVDLKRLGLGVTIKNTAKSSQLHRFGVYEYVPLYEALRSPALQAIAIPLTIAEHKLLVRNILLWDLPAFHPLRLDSPLMGKIPLHIFFDSAPDASIVQEIERAWNATHRLKSMFSTLEITFLSIPANLNYYIRDPRKTGEPRKMGPNLHFLAMMRCCKRYRYTQLMETDCVPAKSDWLTDLNAFCTRSEPFWIAGAFLGSLGTVSPSFALHINGNAIYATGDNDFIEFVDSVFGPALIYLTFEKSALSLAYDCLLAQLLTYWISQSGKTTKDVKLDAFSAAIQANLDKFRYPRLIRNTSHVDADSDEDALCELLDGDAVIVHSRSLTKLVTEKHRDAMNWDVVSLSNGALRRRMKDTFIKVSADEMYSSHYYSNHPEIRFELFDRTNGVVVIDASDASTTDEDPNVGAYLLFETGSPTTGHIINCHVSVRSESAQTVSLRFCRNGAGKFVEDKAIVQSTNHVPGTATLCIRCTEDYDALRLQLKPIGGSGGKLKVEFHVELDTNPANALRTASIHVPGKSVQEIYAMFGDRDALRRSKMKANTATDELVGHAAVDSKQGHAPAESSRKRLLIIDSTPIGRHGSATGQLKSTLLAGWPDKDLLQVWEAPNSGEQPLRLITRGQSTAQSRAKAMDVAQLLQHCIDYQPDVVYIRPNESLRLLRFAEQLLKETGCAAVVHVMDDWPLRMKYEDPEQYPEADFLLRLILNRSNAKLSICDDMSREYEQRYGQSWSAIANGVDVSAYDSARKPRAPVSPESPFVIRYMGGVAQDMNYQSVLDFAAAASSVSMRMPLRFEIYTMPWYRDRISAALAGLPGTQVMDLVPDDKYIQTLCNADALLLTYNFDPASIRYVGFSLANKMPECLASGAPLIAYGPISIATIRYLRHAACAELVTKRNQADLIQAIELLATNEIRRKQLVAAAHQHALAKLDSFEIRSRFQRILIDAAESGAQSVQMPRDPSRFTQANRLYREGRYRDAMNMYVELYRAHPMDLYKGNALRCLSRIDLTSQPSTI